MNLPATVKDELRKKIMVDKSIALEEVLFHQAQVEMFNIMLGAHSRHLHRRTFKRRT